MANFTAEEEARIQKEVQEQLKRDREAEIQNEINNRVADARNAQPGHGY